MLTVEELRKNLLYDPETGIFTWLDNQNPYRKRRFGKEAGGIDRKGYRRIRVGVNLYFAHRLAWLCITGEWPKDQIDHINEIKDDNRYSNLREASNGQNQQNCGLRKDNASGFKRVDYYPKYDKFRAVIGIGGKQKHIGYFSTPEEAYAAYLKEAEKYHGEYAHA